MTRSLVWNDDRSEKSKQVLRTLVIPTSGHALGWVVTLSTSQIGGSSGGCLDAAITHRKRTPSIAAGREFIRGGKSPIPTQVSVLGIIDGKWRH